MQHFPSSNVTGLFGSRHRELCALHTVGEPSIMPIALNPAEELPLPKWQRPAKTTHDLPWAEIKVLDLSTFDEPGAKQKLAEELREAVRIAN